MNACRKGNAFLVKCLIAILRVPISIQYIETPVHIACRMQRLDILQILVQNCSNNSKVDSRNSFGETPLCIGLYYNDCY